MAAATGTAHEAPRVTDTGCPHPASARRTLVPETVGFTPEEAAALADDEPIPRPIVWCRMCGAVCRAGEWTAPLSIVLPGWSCTKCGVFNGAAKELRNDCRSCGAPLDMETTK